MAWSGQPVIVEETIRKLHPDNPRLQRLRDEDRIVVSEPLADLPGVWQEIPESTVLVVQPGPDAQQEFNPRFEPAEPALS
jgi:glutamine amidotransferase